MSTPSESAPRAPLLSTADALAALLAAAVPIADTESVATLDALGRVLAADVVSELDVPPAHISAMDGYAVRVADLLHGERRLPRRDLELVHLDLGGCLAGAEVHADELAVLQGARGERVSR